MREMYNKNSKERPLYGYDILTPGNLKGPDKYGNLYFKAFNYGTHHYWLATKNVHPVNPNIIYGSVRSK